MKRTRRGIAATRSEGLVVKIAASAGMCRDQRSGDRDRESGKNRSQVPMVRLDGVELDHACLSMGAGYQSG
jgi:hypothetical protein